MKHSAEEVQEFVINRMDNWFEDMDEDSKEYDILGKAYDNIQTDCMLSKEQANTLERKLDDECRFLSESTVNSNKSFILHVDSLSIYTDAWAQYCRPGTYRI